MPRIHGSRLRPIRSTDIDFILSNISKKDECWNWLGNFENKIPYYRGYRIRRVLWTRLHGRTRSRIGVTCNNNNCINPAHLTNDKFGNYSKVIPDSRGELNGNHKLTAQQVRDIRRKHASGSSAVYLSGLYKVCEDQIYNIVLRRHWRHIS